MKKFLFENMELAQSLLKKIIYFDIFSYPLLPEEIAEYCNYPDLNYDKMQKVLDELRSTNMTNYKSGFYFLGNDESKIEKRLEENHLAIIRMNTARKYSSLVSKFPFVRAVFISGSLSKNVMKPDSDIDFFIITQPGRLWLCRALLTIFKKIFLWNSHRNFCLNYFIDTNSLEIPDKNVFTATEIAFLLPMYNYLLYQEFMKANDWYRLEYPNLNHRSEALKIKPPLLKRILEKILNNRIGNKLDDWSFSVISGFWRKKFSYFSEKQFSLNMRSLKNVSKHHPNSFQERVLKTYKEKIFLFEKSTGFSLNKTSEKSLVK